ncbi:MAG: ribosome maturation factor RimM [Nitrosomonas sp.]|nr:ribosome maturation factor RimM [Nitrosomonas sp.]
MGHVINAFGILGWIKVQPYTNEIDGLLEYKTWWLGQENNHWNEMQVITARINGNTLHVKLKECDDRDHALQLKGMQIAVPRNELPDLPENGEHGYYWSDLIGAEVVNLNSEKLGTVTGLIETGSNDILRVKTGNIVSERPEHSGSNGTQELLIPFIEKTFIKKVNLACSQIVVDWELDY